MLESRRSQLGANLARRNQLSPDNDILEHSVQTSSPWAASDHGRFLQHGPRMRQRRQKSPLPKRPSSFSANLDPQTKAPQSSRKRRGAVDRPGKNSCRARFCSVGMNLHLKSQLSRFRSFNPLSYTTRSVLNDSSVSELYLSLSCVTSLPYNAYSCYFVDCDLRGCRRR